MLTSDADTALKSPRIGKKEDDSSRLTLGEAAITRSGSTLSQPIECAGPHMTTESREADGRYLGQFGFGQYESDRAGVRRPRDDAMAGRGSRRRRLRGGAVRLRPRRDFRRVTGDQGGLFAQPLDGPGGDEFGHAG